ncbi:hypothetical protein PVA45_05705 [Entomospira entomophila]|uniref:Uncharacterized protein n=1 Tax=Entomospira entomophila TaxID=2719988 RepID=A0A968KRQ5_9SPIO|nr:hypothetical protein [Entomospira entomophilus]NIZ40993.1 hypothetical protein [Entomospira entomophilus]WDI35206.1 hypothetical protein PVA45_05705 [Entomospira entomophilus]
MLKKLLLIMKSILQALLTTFSLMVILSVLQQRLEDFLEPLNPELPTSIAVDALSQLLVFAILALPFALISHLVLKYLYQRQIIDTSWMPYIVASSIVIICVLITLHIPAIAGLYIIYVFMSSQMIANQFYFLAISYLIISMLYRIFFKKIS